MEFRELSPEERLEMTDLQARSFFFAYDRKKLMDEIAGGARWRAGYGIFEQGKLTAGLDLLPFEVWFDGGVVGMGGVAGVACAPEERGGGRVRMLMESTVREMHRRGDVFSFLYPFSSRFYRKFGYESCMRLLRVKTPLEAFREYRQPSRVERFLPGEGGSDPSPIVEIYNDIASGHNLCVDREGWRWRGLLERDPATTRRHTYVCYDGDGRPGAYLIFRSEPEHGEAEEMRVLEACWRDTDSLKGLLGFMGGFCSNLKTLVWELPESLAPELIWRECANVKMEVVCNGMCRVIHAAKALRLMRKPEGSGSVRISVTDAVLPENTGIYKVSWENGEGETRKIKSGSADLECSIFALTQLVTGYLPLERARFREDVMVNGKEEELKKLFIKKDVYIADKF